MRIGLIQLRNYRVYQHLDLEMPGGVVGVYGANGSGKSSLLESIVWALFGKARTQKQHIPTVGEPGECSATIEFEHEGHFYRVKRSISGQSFTVKARVWFGEEIAADGPTEVERFIQSVLGLDAASFRSSVFAEQKQLAAFSDQAPDKRRQMVLQLLGITPLEKARDRARAEARDLKAQLDRAAPLLTNLTEAEAAVVEAEAALMVARTNVDAQTTVCDRAVELAGETAKAVKVLEENERRDRSIRERGSALRRELDQLGLDRASLEVDLAEVSMIPAQLLELEQAAGTVGSLQQWSTAAAMVITHSERLAKFPVIEARKVLGPTEAELAAADVALRVVEAAKSSKVGEIKAIEQQSVVAKKAAARTVALDGADACPTCGQALGASVDQMRQHHADEVATLAHQLTGANAALAELAAKATSAQRSYETLKRAAQKASLQLVESAASEGRRQLTVDERNQAVSQLVALSKSAEFALPDELHRLHKDFLSSLETLTPTPNPALAATIDVQATGQLRAAVDTRLRVALESAGKADGLRSRAASLKRLQSRREDASVRQAALETERSELLIELKTLGFDRAVFERAVAAQLASSQQVDDARRSLTLASTAAGRQEGLTEARRAALSDAAERHAKLAEQLAEAHVLLKTSALLHDFRQHIVGLIGPQLQIQASSLFNDLTNHDYDGLEVDADSYELRIIDQGVAHPTSRFSGSEVDLANLALRVAISEQIRFQAGGQVGLLVLDEALASLDAERKDRTLNALGQLGGRFQQILVVTHSPEVKEQLPVAIEVRRVGSSGIRSSTATVLASHG